MGRNFVATLTEVANADAWGEGDAERVRTAARSFSQLLRQHIDKEDSFLYPMAMNAIPQPAFETVNQRCAEVEKKHADDGATARLEALAAELQQRYS